jgi:Tfp pilus assembly protein PilN
LQNSPKIVAVLDIGYSETTLCIYKENRLNFIRKLSFSSDKLTLALTPEFTYEKAEDIKMAFGIPQDETMFLSDNVQAVRVILLMRPLLEDLVKELKRSFDYFMANFKEEGPSLLYLSGGGASLKNLDRYLNKELNIKVSALALPTCVSIDSAEKEKINNDWNQIANILGLALAKVESINLLPPELKTQKIEFIEKASLKVAGIVVGAIFLFLFLTVQFQIGDYRKRLKNAEAHLQNLAEVRAIKEKVDVRENLVAKIQKNKVPADGLLKLISVLLPNNIILEEMLLDENSRSLVLNGVVSATTDTAETVLSTFMNKIETSPFFTEATLVSSKDSGGVHEFQIKCDLAR